MGLVNISKKVGTILGTTAKAMKKHKVLTGVGVGIGGTAAFNYAVDDKHDKSSHGRKKTAETMTKMEIADQKYAISKSYEREGHPRKSREYKNKAAQAYKRAWEIKNK